MALNTILNKESISFLDLIHRLNKKFDWIGIHQVFDNCEEEPFDVFVGCFKLDENDKIITIDGDTYTTDMEVWGYKEFTNRGIGIINGLSIWVREY